MTRRDIWRAAAAAVASVLLWGCQTGGTLGERVRLGGDLWSGVGVNVGKAQLVVSAPYLGGAGLGSPSWGHCTHPMVLPYTSNRLFLTYCIVGDEDDGKAGTATADWPFWSGDGGETWQYGDPFVWVNGRPPHVTAVRAGQDAIMHMGYRSAFARLPGGVVVGYEPNFRYADQIGEISVLKTHGAWTRDGVTLHGPHEILFYAPVRLVGAWMNPRGVVLPDGSLLATVYGTIDKERRSSGFFSLVIYKSTDGGQTFAYMSTIGTPEQVPWGTEGPDEADMLLLPDGDLLCVARTGPGGAVADGAAPMLLARSSDQGMTWERSPMEISGVNPRLLRLQNGVIVLGYGRPDLNLIFSEDGGRTWRKQVRLNRYGELTSGYLDMVEIAPNRLLLVYDLQGVAHEGKKINGIFSQFIDVEFDGPKP